jgi:hypothetical protein
VLDGPGSRLLSSIMTSISESQSLTREEKFVALVHLYVELRLPFDAALDAAAADLFARSDKGPKETARRSSCWLAAREVAAREGRNRSFTKAFCELHFPSSAFLR